MRPLPIDARNLEFKARIPSIGAAAAKAKQIRARFDGLLIQRDTYFRVREGRLKLREMRGGRSELIRYFRPDRRGPRISEYRILPVRRPEQIREFLGASLGILTVVKKRRRVFLLKNARIHLDKVDRLGSFIEFEVIVRSGLRQARAMMKRLTKSFALEGQRSLAFSYSDLMLRNGKTRS